MVNHPVIENSIGMRLVHISPGEFLMGESEKDEVEWDELPVHRVCISRSFYAAVTPVTNAQYEQFNPAHKRWRGKNGLSAADDEAVIWVSWVDAVQFCEWLSQKEGKPYRLPTEAEWEYMCRAGTTTVYWTGNDLPPEFHRDQFNDVSWTHSEIAQTNLLRVGQTPANPWGLCDMHGIVEEWCFDWYGLYPSDGHFEVDPIGCITGESRVTRGGSHHTDIHYLRSATRLGAIPEDKHWYIGFRIIQGDFPKSEFHPVDSIPLCMKNVSNTKFQWQTSNLQPIFLPPKPYVLTTANKSADKGLDPRIPLLSHNHCPAITWCENGDLLAIWFSTHQEAGREMLILGSRLRANTTEWEPASLFFKIPGRNMTGSALYNDRKGTLYHFNGVEAAGSWENLVMTLRTSQDYGATWSKPRLINAQHQYKNQVICCTIQDTKGNFLQCCDASPHSEGGTVIHISKDGFSWEEPSHGLPIPQFHPNEKGSWIAGIHASIVVLSDGRLIALGRQNNIDGNMPKSIADFNYPPFNWTYSSSGLPPISGGQRLALIRLQEGPIFLASFTDYLARGKNKELKAKGLKGRDVHGNITMIFGLYVALSLDEGQSWSHFRVVSDGSGRNIEGGAHTGSFCMDATHGEPGGYLAVTQTPDGLIHLISSRLHYCFNFKWILHD